MSLERVGRAEERFRRKFYPEADDPPPGRFDRVIDWLADRPTLAILTVCAVMGGLGALSVWAATHVRG